MNFYMVKIGEFQINKILGVINGKIKNVFKYLYIHIKFIVRLGLKDNSKVETEDLLCGCEPLCYK